MNRRQPLDRLLQEIRACRHCEMHLELGPRPILGLSNQSRILIVGQAPGIRVHQTGIAWNDPSGDRLRDWMGISKADFYNEKLTAIVPMGFCYPGRGKSGDLPPRPECAELWHDKVMQQLTHVELTLVVGVYAQTCLLAEKRKRNLTETIENWKDYRPGLVPLPHPSPRNIRWFKNNPWFEESVLPYLRRRVKRICSKPDLR